MSEQQAIDFSILDSNIEDLADMQSFEPWPEGTYGAIFDWETKGVNGAAVVDFKFKFDEVLELANTESVPPKDKAVAQISAFLSNQDGSISENGQGMVKLVAKALQPTFGGVTARETLDAAKGGKVAVTFKVTNKTKDGELKHYQKLVALLPV